MFAVAGCSAAGGGARVADASAPQKLLLYVDASGNDAWTGGLARVNATKTDGPLRTLEGARDRIRDLKKKGKFTKPVDVRVAAMWMEPDSAFVLEPQDSGTAECPIRYIGAAAAPGSPAARREAELTILSGGRKLQIKEAADGIVRGIVNSARPGELTPAVFVHSFESDDSRLQRARLPKTGFYTIEESAPPTGKWGGRFDQFQYSAGNVDKSWKNPGDVEVVVSHLWTNSRLRISNINEKSRILTFSGAVASDQSWSAMPKGNRYYLENVAEAMTAPGDFCYHSATRELEILPPPNAKGVSSASGVPGRYIVPALEAIIELRGDPAAGKFTSYIYFENIHVGYSAWNTPAGGYSFPQAEVGLDAAVRLTGARNCKFKNMNIRHTGAWAVSVGQGCRNVEVESCTFDDLGAGGVKIGEQALRENDELVTSNITIKNCEIRRGGRLHAAAVGIWIGQSHDNRIENNHISDFYYTGISLGWTWGYGPHNAHHNKIINNHIHDIGQGVLSDMGGIYTLGVQPGTELRNNRIHDVNSYGYGGWGIYLDEGATGILVDGNIVYKTKSAGFHQHYGKDNIIQNNIFALGREFQIMRTRAEAHRSFIFKNNIIYFREGALLGSNWDGDLYDFDGNTYWREGGGGIQFGAWSWDEWRARGKDIHGKIEDPKFNNPEVGDFSRREK